MGGYAKNIKVELLKDNKVAITDDGRGIPVDIHSHTKKSALVKLKARKLHLTPIRKFLRKLSLT